jgi:hypothetical protein
LRPKVGGVKFAQLAEAQCRTNLSGLYQPVQLTSKLQILLTGRETSSQIQNADSFTLSDRDF